MIRWTCPWCSKPLKANDADAGKRARCPQCGVSEPIPAFDVELVAVVEPTHLPVATHYAPPTRPVPAAVAVFKVGTITLFPQLVSWQYVASSKKCETRT